jgi:putative IMPACT (imprinted ancient) family translation regulator
LIVVIRYFGGTKLGVGGLIHAYKTAAADAMQNNQIVQKLIFKELHIEFEYPQMNLVMKLIKDHELQIMDQKLEMSCEMRLGVRLSMEKQVVDIINDTQGLTILT